MLLLMWHEIDEREVQIFPAVSNRMNSCLKVLYSLQSNITFAMKKISMISCLMCLMLFLAAQTVIAEEKVKIPPLPLQNVEGFGGILLTGSAYLINPSEEGTVFGLPALETSLITRLMMFGA